MRYQFLKCEKLRYGGKAGQAERLHGVIHGGGKGKNT